MDKKLTGLIILFLIIFASFTTYTLFGDKLRTFTRAATETVASSSDSLIYAWPLSVNLSESKTSEVTVFVRNGNKLPIANKLVTLSTNFGQILNSTVTSDSSGKAVFTIKSDSPGLATIKATVDSNINLVNDVSVEFK